MHFVARLAVCSLLGAVLNVSHLSAQDMAFARYSCTPVHAARLTDRVREVYFSSMAARPARCSPRCGRFPV